MEDKTDEQTGEVEQLPLQPKFQEITVAELGPMLPLGIVGGDGKIKRSLRPRPWRLKEEKALGRRREQDPDRNMGKYVSIVLAMMYEEFAGQRWTDFIEEGTIDRELTISQMWMPDVFYAYVWLRIQSLGHELSVDLKSPYTGKEFKFIGDLRTVKVKVPTNLASCLYTYKLRDSITVRGKEVTMLVLGPQRWHTIEEMGDISMGAAKGSVIHSSIHSVPEVAEGDIALSDEELDELSKHDLENLTDLIDKNGFGPEMKMEPVCPTRKRKFEVPIDWRYDSFFATSSPSPS